jgi:hypothetical protein
LARQISSMYGQQIHEPGIACKEAQRFAVKMVNGVSFEIFACVSLMVR